MAETLLIRVATDATKLRSGLAGAQSSLKSFGNKASLFLSAPIIAGVGKVVAELATVAKVEAQTGAVLKSTGMKANVTAKQIKAHADGLEHLTGIEAEVIQAGQNMLLTFTNIRNGVGKGNDVFTQATEIMNDMSVALGQDTKSSAMQLGKALNDPIKGVGALRRVGVAFTDDQKELIEKLVGSGRTMEAQKLILRELRTEFGGSAKAAGDTFAGSIAKARIQVGNAAESMVVSLLPAIKSGAEFVQRLAKRFQALTPHQKKMILLSLGIAAALGPVVRVASAMITVIRGVSAALMLLSANPIVLLVAAVVAAGVAFYVFRDRIGRGVEKVKSFFVDLGRGIKEVVMAPIRFLVDRFLWGLGLILGAAARAFGWIPGIGPKLKAAKTKFDEFRAEVNASLRGIKAPRVNIILAAKIKDDFTRRVLLGQVQGPLTRAQLAHLERVARIGVRAKGGPVYAGAPYIVGERGPELFVPRSSGKIVPNHHLGRGGGGAPVTNIFYIQNPDPAAVARDVARILGRQQDLRRRAG